MNGCMKYGISIRWGITQQWKVMDEPWRQHARLKTPARKGHLSDSIHTKCPEEGNQETECRLLAA